MQGQILLLSGLYPELYVAHTKKHTHTHTHTHEQEFDSEFIPLSLATFKYQRDILWPTSTIIICRQNKHQHKLITQYITVIKPRCHCRAQLLIEEVYAFPDHQEIFTTGCIYCKTTELHVDNHECLQAYVN